MPPNVVGRITPSTVRQRLTPSARLRLAQRGRHEQQHLLRRARDERQHDDRERERAGVGALPVPDDEQAVDEDADDDRRQPVEHVEHELDRPRDPARCELRQVDRDQHADRQGHRVAIADDRSRSRSMRAGDPAARPPKRLGGSVKKSQLSAGPARTATETTTITSTATASSAASVPSALHDPVDDAAAAQLTARPQRDLRASPPTSVRALAADRSGARSTGRRGS